MSESKPDNVTCKDGVCELPTDEKSVEKKGSAMNPPDMQSILSSSFENIHNLLTQSMKEEEAKGKKHRKSRKRHDVSSEEESDNESESSENESDDSESDEEEDDEYRTFLPNYKWGALHQLLDSHHALCTAFTRLLTRDEE